MRSPSFAGLGGGLFVSLNDRLETKSYLLVAGSDMRNNRNNIWMSLTLPSEPVPHHLNTVSMFASSSSS